MRSLASLLLLTFVGTSLSITLEETTYFRTTGNAEQNTGIVGNVTIEEDPSDSNFWLLTSNGVPDHFTPFYPNVDNPNEIRPQRFLFQLPKTPDIASEASCLPPGPIGIAINGVALFNPWDDDNENAVEGSGAEVFDICDGHPTPQGVYHYHKEPSGCVFSVEEGVPSTIIGIALDGFAIYGPNDEDGNILTSDDLDECHGRYNSDGVYQYHTTSDYPYLMGCYRGTPVRQTGGDKCFFADDMIEETNSPTADDGGGAAGIYVSSVLIALSSMVADLCITYL